MDPTRSAGGLGQQCAFAQLRARSDYDALGDQSDVSRLDLRHAHVRGESLAFYDDSGVLTEAEDDEEPLGLRLVRGLPLGFFGSGIFSGLADYLAELYLTELRGAGQGFGYNIGRGIGGGRAGRDRCCGGGNTCYQPSGGAPSLYRHTPQCGRAQRRRHVHHQQGARRLRRHDWAGLARGYNGAGFRKNGCDTKLAAA